MGRLDEAPETPMTLKSSTSMAAVMKCSLYRSGLFMGREKVK